MKCFFACVLALVNVGFVHADSDSILEAARMNPLGVPITLNAQLRAGDKKVPFQIAVRDGIISYIFKNPDQEIRLRLGEESSIVEERRDGKTTPVAPTTFDDSVRGGLLTYEDLALRFLYWKNSRVLGEETIRSRPTTKIEIPAPVSGTQYGVVRVWIDRESGALLRTEGYDREGKLIKRFEVVSAQKLDGQWMLRQMRVERIDPNTRKTTGRTYLEVLGRAE